MGTGVLIAMLSGSALFGGVFWTVLAVRGTLVDPLAPPPPARRRRSLTANQVRGRQLTFTVAAVIGIGAWLVTGLVLSALVLAGLIAVVPWLLRPTRSDKSGIERLEALEEWTRRLAAVTVLGAGLEQALIESVATAPDPIQAPVTDLSARLQARWPIDQALRMLAADLASTGGDTVTLALISAADNRGPGLSSALSGLANTMAEHSRMRREIEAHRGESRTTVRYITVTILAIAGLGAFDRSYIQPYQTPVGVGVLVVLVGLFAATFAWMRRLVTGQAEVRLINDQHSQGGRR